MPRLGTAQGHQRISEYFSWWLAVDDLMWRSIEDLRRASGGQVTWRVAERFEFDEFRPTTDLWTDRTSLFW